jgi:hypothetical protein
MLMNALPSAMHTILVQLVVLDTVAAHCHELMRTASWYPVHLGTCRWLQRHVPNTKIQLVWARRQHVRLCVKIDG